MHYEIDKTMDYEMRIRWVADFKMHERTFQAAGVIDAMEQWIAFVKDEGHKDIMIHEMRDFCRRRVEPSREVT